MSKERAGAVGQVVKGTVVFNWWSAAYAKMPTLADCLANDAVGCEIMSYFSCPLYNTQI